MSNEFIATAAARGLIVERVIADGEIHRVPVEGRPKTDKRGWYKMRSLGSGRAFAIYGRWDDGRGADTWHEGEDAKPLTKAENVAIAEIRAYENKQREQEQRDTAKAAQSSWDRFSTEGESPYLKRKAVEALGIRFDGAVACIPLRDADGVLWSLQRIAPDGKKQFHPGGRMVGCFHLIGTVADRAPLLIAEGYATGATLHRATGAPVAIAMNCGNIGPVADALKKRYPKARLVICADDDAKTERERGINPGTKAASETAARLKCEWLKPHGLREDATDFNDLAAHSGIDEVTTQLAKVLPSSRTNGASNVKPDSIPRFELNAEGVWHFGCDKNGEATKPVWICAPLTITARTRDVENTEWGYLLEFKDPEGKPHSWAMPARMLAGDGNEYRQHLLSLGLSLSTSNVARERLTYYIQTQKPEELARCTDRAGWHDSIFVLPERTLGKSDERVIYQSSGAVANTFRESGALDDWKSKIADLCRNNSRLVFAVSAAFAGPTLCFTGMESGGFHFRGGSSSGKTTALRVAASVYGGPDFMQRWRATDNAMEGMAALHSDAILILDELSQVDGRVAGDCAYLLANGQAKARQSRTGAPRQTLKWRIVFLSAGEISLADHMAEANKRTRTGQEVRFADIPADAGKKLGLFEDLHGIADGSKFANTLNAHAGRAHGVAGRMFIERLAGDVEGAKSFLKTKMQAFIQVVRREAAEGQAQRVAARFAQVAAAGELATSWGITGWPEGMAMKSVEGCYRAWLSARGGAGNAEERDMIRQVIEFLERNGESRFTHYGRAEKSDDHMPDTVNRAGFKRPASEEDGAPFEFFVLYEVFKRDVCKGFDSRDVAKVLKQHGFIKTDKDRPTKSVRLPTMGKVHCYQILPAIFEYERMSEGGDGVAA